VTVDAFFGQPPQSIWGWEAAASAEECRRFAVTLVGANARLGAEVVSLLLPRGGLAPPYSLPVSRRTQMKFQLLQLEHYSGLPTLT